MAAIDRTMAALTEGAYREAVLAAKHRLFANEVKQVEERFDLDGLELWVEGALAAWCEPPPGRARRVLEVFDISRTSDPDPWLAAAQEIDAERKLPSIDTLVEILRRHFPPDR